MFSLSRAFSYRSLGSRTLGLSTETQQGVAAGQKPSESFPFSELEDELRQQLEVVQQCQRKPSAQTPDRPRTAPVEPDIVPRTQSEVERLDCYTDAGQSTGPSGALALHRSDSVPDGSSFDWVTAEEEALAQAKIEPFRGRQWLKRAMQEQQQTRVRRSARFGVCIVAALVAGLVVLWALNDPLGLNIVLGETTRLFF